uniref:Superoxide dismutase copper/zinc binding domain-containing protein n=1 Tax=Mola mola TaxID=94237 RepID=A0A3Q4C0G2_MOLML
MSVFLFGSTSTAANCDVLLASEDPSAFSNLGVVKVGTPSLPAKSRLNTSDPAYPKVPGSTHDRYEMGDLSAKHMSLAGKNKTDEVFTDFNLPLFGRNSIVGHSVVIHQTDSSSGFRDPSKPCAHAVIIRTMNSYGL